MAAVAALLPKIYPVAASPNSLIFNNLIQKERILGSSGSSGSTKHLSYVRKNQGIEWRAAPRGQGVWVCLITYLKMLSKLLPMLPFFVSGRQ